MAAINSYLFKRAINQFLKCNELDSDKGKALVDKIKDGANDNLNVILETMTGAPALHRDLLKAICIEKIENLSEDFFLNSLSHNKTSIRSSASEILVQSNAVKPEKLFKRLKEPDVNFSEILTVLRTQKSSLKPEDIINNAMRLEASNALQLLKLAEELLTPLNLAKLAVQPKKIKDPALKINLLRYLSSVQQAAVADLIIEFLSDINKSVVLEALKSLTRLSVRFDVSPVLPLISGMSEAHQTLALEVITNQINPFLIPQLSICFSTKLTALHHALVIIIADHVNKKSFVGFLSEFETKDSWTKDQIINLFLKLNNSNLLSVAKELSSHDSEFVRSCAQKISGYDIDDDNLEKIGEFALNEDWQVSLRAIQTLGKSANPASVGILQKVLSVRPDVSVAVLNAVKQLGYSSGLGIAFLCLDNSEISIQRSALETIASIADEKHAKSARDSITWKIPTFEPEIAAIANLIIEKINFRFDPSANKPSPDKQSDMKMPMLENLESIKIGSVWMERYRILKEIGRGTMGFVMLVEDEVIGESLVLKFMHPELTIDPDSRERFKREFAYTRKVSHPSVIRVHDLFLKDDICALSMEYFESHGINELFNKKKAIGDRKGLEILLQVSSGMAAAHKQGVIHRDLKPSNILINQLNQVKIVDFGIAAATTGIDSTLTKTGAIIGSPAYLAPERVGGLKADNRSDIYSLGIIAYYMFSGVLPYVGKPMAILLKHRQGNAPLVHQINKNINPGISALISNMMAIDPDKRPQSMLTILDQVKVLLAAT